jgi:hypothetical protein
MAQGYGAASYGITQQQGSWGLRPVLIESVESFLGKPMLSDGDFPRACGGIVGGEDVNDKKLKQGSEKNSPLQAVTLACKQHDPL